MTKEKKTEPRPRIANVVSVGRNGGKVIGQIDQITGKPVGGTIPKAKAPRPAAPPEMSDRSDR